MVKRSFWQDASYYGAILGLVAVIEQLAIILLPAIAGLSSIAGLVVTIYLMIRFTRQRAALFPEQGYSYGQSFGLMTAMGIFAGVVVGAFSIVAANWLFPEFFNEQFVEMRKLLVESYTKAGLDSKEVEQSIEMIRKMLFSPMWVLFSTVLGSVLGKGFIALFASMAAKREPDVFYSEQDEQDEYDE